VRKRVVILAKQDESGAPLANRSACALQQKGRRPLSHVLVELAQRTGSASTVEAGAVQQCPRSAKHPGLVLDNATVQDALEAISGSHHTGLDYMIREGGIYVWEPGRQR